MDLIDLILAIFFTIIGILFLYYTKMDFKKRSGETLVGIFVLLVGIMRVILVFVN